MTKAFLFFLLGCCLTTGSSAAELTKVGQLTPEFRFTTLAGKTTALNQLRGKVVLVNFFATWCAPCMAEMPRLEQEIWRTLGTNGDLVVVAIGREHTRADLEQFLKKNSFSFLLAPDPKREIYAKFATQGMPRNYLIDAAGHIVYQSEGYGEEEFKRLLQAVKKALAGNRGSATSARNSGQKAI